MSVCHWCSAPFTGHAPGQHEKRFCSDACRAAFHRGLRRWASAAHDAGMVEVQTLRRFANGSERAVYGDGGAV